MDFFITHQRSPGPEINLTIYLYEWVDLKSTYCIRKTTLFTRPAELCVFFEMQLFTRLLLCLCSNLVLYSLAQL